MLPREVFLSHTSADRAWVEALVNVLRQHGVPVWYSQTNVVGAQQWQDEIGKALRRCDWFLIVLSPRSVQSMWVRRELNYALDERRLDDRIVPVRYQPCEPSALSWVLPTLQMVDFEPGWEQGCRDLLRVWGLGLQTSP